MNSLIPKKYDLSASLICANILELGQEIQRLEQGGIDSLHFDVMDASFVPRYGLHPEILAAVRSKTNLPIHVHAMVDNFEPYIEQFIESGATTIMPHVESHVQLHRIIKKINDMGGKSGVALNLATPLNILDYIIDDIKVVMLMAINPGIVGHKLIPQAFNKITDLKKKIADRSIDIEVDGGVTLESAAKMIQCGATRLVCGTSIIFRPHEATLEQKIKEAHECIDRELRLN